MSQADRNIESVVNFLVANGWRLSGRTMGRTVRIPTIKNPVYGRIGGEIITVKGRQRLQYGDIKLFCTVGPRTTNFYTTDRFGCVLLGQATMKSVKNNLLLLSDIATQAITQFNQQAPAAAPDGQKGEP